MNEDGKEPDEYMYPRVQFVEYSPTGEILMFGMMALGFVKDLEKEGRLILRTDIIPTVDSRVNLETKTFEPKPPCPAVLEGTTLTNIPIPSRVTVYGQAYDVDDGVLEMEITTPGKYAITVENPLYLKGSYEVVV